MRLKGDALAMIRRIDALVQIAGLQEERRLMQEMDVDDEQLADIDDHIAGLRSGAYAPRIPAYDERDAVADRVGEENPIEWVRWTERRVREAKRLRRIVR